MNKSPLNLLTEARRVLASEMAAIAGVRKRLGKSFEKAFDILLNVQGKVLLSGVGKSGLVARKIAATFTSTGTPAVFIHPVDCLHGDIGVLTGQDAAIIISNSGHTQELLDLIPSFRRFRVPVIGIMTSGRSGLGRACDVVVETGPLREACPYNLAPTSSSTAVMALGDALAIALLKKKGFKKDDFALLHQAGTLGRRLQLRVSDLMWKGEQIPKVQSEASLQEAILVMTSINLGITTVVDKNNRLQGVLTDGDLRRIFQNRKFDFASPVSRVMIRNPKTVGPEMLAAQALALMEKHSITALVCVENRKVTGVIHIHDILKAGVV